MGDGWLKIDNFPLLMQLDNPAPNSYTDNRNKKVKTAG